MKKSSGLYSSRKRSRLPNDDMYVKCVLYDNLNINENRTVLNVLLKYIHESKHFETYIKRTGTPPPPSHAYPLPPSPSPVLVFFVCTLARVIIISSTRYESCDVVLIFFFSLFNVLCSIQFIIKKKKNSVARICCYDFYHLLMYFLRVKSNIHLPLHPWHPEYVELSVTGTRLTPP